MTIHTDTGLMGCFGTDEGLMHDAALDVARLAMQRVETGQPLDDATLRALVTTYRIAREAWLDAEQ